MSNVLTATATNAAATITLAAIPTLSQGTKLGTSNKIDRISFSYSGTPTGGRITVVDGTARTVADGVTTSSSQTITSATAAFTAADVGATVTGTGIGANAKIQSVTNGTTAVLTVNSSASASSVSITITPAIFDIDVTAGGPQTLLLGLTGSQGNPMSIILAAGGSSITGKINVSTPTAV